MKVLFQIQVFISLSLLSCAILAGIFEEWELATDLLIGGLFTGILAMWSPFPEDSSSH